MKNLKLKFISIIVLSYINQILCVEKFYLVKTNNKYKNFVFIDLTTKTEDSSFFYTCALEIRNLLEYCHKNNLPVALLIPENLQGFSPICQEAPFIEGIRVALAWVSAYFRLNKIDVRILKVSEKIDKNILLDSCSYYLSTNIDDEFLSSEEKLKLRIINYQNTDNKKLNKSNFELSQIDLQIKQTKIMLKTNLPNSKINQKRILISGACGFIGCHLVRKLLEQGHQIIGIDNLFCSTLDNIKDIKSKNFTIIKHDVSIPFDIEGQINEVIHLASIPSPEFYYKYPIETLLSGLHGTKNMLDIATSKQANFLLASTSEVYGDAEISPQTEQYTGNVSPIDKRSQYDQSKRGAETLTMLQFNTFNLNVRIARIFNTYGPYMGLNDGRVVTNFIKSILQDQPMKIYGQGKQTRSFCYIDDMVNGLVYLLNVKRDTEIIEDYVFNIGNPDEITINELARRVNTIAFEKFGKTTSIQFIDPIDKTDPKQRKPDISKINKLFGFYPKISLAEGLGKCFDFYLKS